MQLIHTVASQRFDPKAADFDHPRGQVVRKVTMADTESVTVGGEDFERNPDGTFTVPAEVGEHLVDNVPGWDVFQGIFPGVVDESPVDRRDARIAELEAELAKAKRPAKAKATE